MIDASEALQRLREGNERYLAGERGVACAQDFASLAEGQAPAAIILGCSDSRVVPEAIFDQPLGELFVVRVAGNVASPEVVASIEFALLHFGSPLLVVMGHTDCGAVSAAIAELSEPTSEPPRNIKGLMDRMIPAIKSVRPSQDEDGAWMRQAVRANVAASLRGLLQNSAPIKEAVGAQTLTVVGAEYNLSTGAVEFLD
ncbi:MAG: carbonic anhydrase [Planctomycetota bacterium]|jgi:carbonic anhydrase|nr:carbonic anhydrase [Planctomycetota bacterium]MDP6739196.1 carbonic anhydrase [Planctomycetota bacterium]MDP6940173.1 carbonic anhydrase [Planctomycetota bacterium]